MDGQVKIDAASPTFATHIMDAATMSKSSQPSVASALARARSVVSIGARSAFLLMCAASPLAVAIGVVFGGNDPYFGQLIRVGMTLAAYAIMLAIGLPLLILAIGVLCVLPAPRLRKLQRYIDWSDLAPHPIGAELTKSENRSALKRTVQWLIAANAFVLTHSSFVGGVLAFLAITSVYVMVAFGAYSAHFSWPSEEDIALLGLLVVPVLILLLRQPYLSTMCLIAQPVVAMLIALIASEIRGQSEHISLWWANAKDCVVIPIITNMATSPVVVLAGWRLWRRWRGMSRAPAQGIAPAAVDAAGRVPDTATQR